MGRLSRRRTVLTIRSGPDGLAPVRRSDQLAVEEPLELRLDGEPYLVTMRTPGDDVDLVHGLLAAERVITGPGDVVLARYCAGTGPDGLNTYNVLDVTLASTARRPDPRLARAVLTSSACGVCGTASIDQVRKDAPYALDPGLRYPVDLLLRAPDLLRTEQRTFARTGGLHAAGLLAPDGTLRCVREDVGRHNAVDKVVGWALRADRLPLADTCLVVSGRASFELVQKAAVAGIAIMVAVSAPSSLAVELAEEIGLTLIGFARGDRLNVYTHADRVGLGA